VLIGSHLLVLAGTNFIFGVRDDPACKDLGLDSASLVTTPCEMSGDLSSFAGLTNDPREYVGDNRRGQRIPSRSVVSKDGSHACGGEGRTCGRTLGSLPQRTGAGCAHWFPPACAVNGHSFI